MKWLFVTLLFGNALFFGWAYTQNLRQAELNADYSISTANRADNSIALFSEMDQPPSLQEDTSSDEWPPEDSASSDGEEHGQMTGPIEQMRNIEYEGDVSLLFDNATESEDESPVCHRFGPLSDGEQTDVLLDWLQQHGIEYREHTPEESRETSYWVYIMPQESVEELSRLIDVLQEQDIHNYRLVRKGKLRNALSLGNYESTADMEQHLADIKEKGYETIVVPQHSSDQERWFDVRIEPHMAQDKTLRELLSRDDRFVVECNWPS